MPSSLHEALVSFFRARPLLAAELLAVAQGLAPLGGVEGVMIYTDLSVAVPAEYRADAAILLLSGGPQLRSLMQTWNEIGYRDINHTRGSKRKKHRHQRLHVG